MAFASQRAIGREAWLHRVGLLCFVVIGLLGVSGYLGDRAPIVVQAVAIYLFLLLVFRVAGRRTLAQSSTFDLVLILIIGDATQQALLGEDSTVGSAALAILCLVSLDMAMSHLKRSVPALNRLLEGDPVLLVGEGVIHEQPLRTYHLTHDDLRAAARANRGLIGLEDVHQATLETDGTISIVPRRKGEP